ncbi:MAG: hypothetical protein V3U78_10840 [Thiotrichaceae bacterium]
MKHASLPIISLLSLMTLSSCSIDKGFVARDWSENLRELNIQPIFPPREDVQVGDVYLLPYSPDTEKNKAQKNANFTPIGTWVHSINLIKELKSHYSQRPDFPKTSYKKTTGSTMERQPTSNGNLFSGGEVNRLKMVLLPTFFKAEVSAFDAASLIPSSALGNLGVSAENIKKAYVTISAASSYGIPVSKVKRKIFENGKFCINKATGMDLETLKFTVDKTGGESKQTQKALLVIATEVFYARKLKVQLSLDKSIGGGNSSNATTISPQEIANRPGSAGSDRNTAEKKLAERQRSLSTSGVRVSAGSSAHSSVSVDRTFERPIAIGFRGLRQIISLDKSPINVSNNCQTTDTASPDSQDSPVPMAEPPPNMKR